MNKLPTIVGILILLATSLVIIGCAANQSIVFSSNSFKPVSSGGSQRQKHKIGLVMSRGMDAVVARSVSQTGAQAYEFEFLVGKDIYRSLPIYLSSIFDTHIIDLGDSSKFYDYILEPKINTSLFLYIGLSGAPRYELSITLEVPITQEGKIKDRILVRKDSRVEISAFENTDDRRTKTMRKLYEAQLFEIYRELEISLMSVVK